MKLLKVLCFLFCGQLVYTQTLDPKDSFSESVYYFIRHAEKDRSNPEDKNPDLNQQGKIRALNWL